MELNASVAASTQALAYATGRDRSLEDELTPFRRGDKLQQLSTSSARIKSTRARHAESMTTDPWSVKVGGLVDQPGQLHLEDLMTGFDLEERIYRFRCVEAWSMVVPWVGFPLI